MEEVFDAHETRLLPVIRRETARSPADACGTHDDPRPQRPTTNGVAAARQLVFDGLDPHEVDHLARLCDAILERLDGPLTIGPTTWR